MTLELSLQSFSPPPHHQKFYLILVAIKSVDELSIPNKEFKSARPKFSVFRLISKEA